MATLNWGNFPENLGLAPIYLLPPKFILSIKEFLYSLLLPAFQQSAERIYK